MTNAASWRPGARRGTAALALAWMAVVATGSPAASDDPRRVAPYAATPDSVTESMLDVARVAAGDHLVDLGSGDGRIVIAAARRGANALGVDIDERFIEVARRHAAAAGVEARAQFVVQDLFETDLRNATVVTLYLFPTIMGRVARMLADALAPGTRVVSHDFALPGWRAERVVHLDAPEKRDSTGMTTATLYYYVVPARAAQETGKR